jgi:hypothetical protein
MALQIRTEVSGVYKFLDLYKDEPVLLSLSFAELQDITKKNSAFSKAFSVPGSQRNNEIFNFFYDLNSIPLDFDPNNKFDAVLLWDGYEILQGHIRLNGVSIASDEIIYQITFYNQIGDLAANIGDKFLFNTNLSGLTHPFTQNVILESQIDPNLFNLTGSTNYSYQSGSTLWGLYNIGYEYLTGTTVNAAVSPLVQFTPTVNSGGTISYNPQPGFFDNVNTPVNNYYFKPTIQVKALYDAICRDAGYEIQSDFFNTSYFEHFYMPMKYLDETIYPRNAIIPCYKYTNAFIGPTFTGVYTNPSTGVTCNSLGFSANSTTIRTIPEFEGTYTWRLQFTVTPTNSCESFITVPPYLYVYFDDGVSLTTLLGSTYCSGTTTVDVTQAFIFTGESNISFILQGEYVDVTNFSAEILSGPRIIPSGSTVDYALEFPDNDYTQLDFITSINKYFNLVMVPNPDKPKSLLVEPIVDYIGKGIVLDWTTKVDFSQLQSIYPTTSLLNGTLEYELRTDQDYANQDFKTQTNRTFGTDKFKLGLEYKDTITKFDYQFSSPIDITIQNAYVPLLTLGSMSKLKTVDKDGQSLQTFVPFKVLPKLIFRGPTLPVDNYGFLGLSGVTGTVVCNSGITFNSTTTCPVFYDDCDGIQQEYYPSVGSNTIPGCADPTTVRNPFGIPCFPEPSITITSTGTTCAGQFFGSPFQYWYMDGFQQDRFNNLNRFTTYPFAYTGFSHYCNFRGEDRTDITPSEFVFQSEDLYDIYYKPYVDDLTSAENKIYACKIYLYPQEIQQLRWNEKILINNTFFRINKITNFNMTEPSICDLELIKLTKEYPGHRVLYYDLIPCAGGAELHSNSDLNYHLYSYANNYVSLYDTDNNSLGCYNVQIGSFNPSYTYNQYFIGTAYTNNLVNVFSDCGCSARTSMDLVQEEPGDDRYFVYRGVVCNTSTEIYFNSTNSSLETSGLVHKVYSPISFTEYCVSGITPYFTIETDYTEVSSHATCAACSCIRCYEYTFGPANTSGLLVWRDCDGVVSDAFVNQGEFYTIPCIGANEGTVSGDGPIVRGQLCADSCVTPTPTRTPTQTPTPGLSPTPTSTTVLATPTPTPTPSETPSNFDHYFADEYLCLYPGCSYVSSGIVVSFPTGTPVSIGVFYREQFPSGLVYQITGSAPSGPGLILTTLNASRNCNFGCFE